MTGIGAIIRKELADHFSSYRFSILFALIAMVSLITTYMVGTGLRDELSGVAKPEFVFLMLFTSTGPLFSLVQFVAFFGPLIGLVLGFDSINRERSSGTLSKLASQPIYRDSIINGKFLSGVITIFIMLASILLVVSGLGLKMIGVVPGIEEVWRLFIYLIISVFYISFWLGISILFSILFRGIATSALATLAIWIFFSFFVSMGASVVANAVVPGDKSEDPALLMKKIRIQRGISLTSPMQLYNDSTAIIIDPMRKTTQSLVLMGPLERLSSARFERPLALSQSIYVVIPHMISLIAISVIFFGISYAVFMRQEIRSM
ncbi:MAG: ABC transporter [Deltaproteobacteria bacterium]|nr:ABC transporter permease [Deltaproteobacteria bacterium]MBW2076082.1 ABC transporter permease [Deltaproteobacteria bacterium]RLB31280.1 MAG: ABC transporter [Deltaproteobacteria bacterium]